jgi:hypothetical protein
MKKMARKMRQGRQSGFKPGMVVALVWGSSTVFSHTASAEQFDLGNGLRGSFDSSISFGMAVRTSSPNCAFIGQDNGGCASSDQVGIARRDPVNFNQSYDLTRLNQDNGNLNYKSGQVFSATLRGVHDLFLKAPDGWSGLMRAAWSYDFAADRTRYADLEPDARSHAVHDIRLLDAYVNKEFEIDQHPVRARVGNQVISWGEDIFIPGGINSINAIDVRRAHSPGVQLKEIFRPAPILSLNAEVAKGLSVEGYYQTRWNGYEFDPVGTFFSTSDIVGRGSTGAFLPTSLVNSVTGPLGLPPAPPGTVGDTGTRIIGVNPSTGLPFNRQLSAGELADPNLNPLYGPLVRSGSVIPRGVDRNPRNSGQFGLSTRYTFPDSGDELALYYIRYHDKIPFASIRVNQGATANPFGWQEIYLDYAEDRNLFGVSYNTRAGDWAFGTELSFRPKESTPIDPTIVSNPNNPYYCNADLNPANYRPTGYVCRGAVDQKKYQFHLTALNIFTPGGSFGGLLRALGATEGTFTSELAAAYYPDLDLNRGIPYSVASDYRSPTKLSSGLVAQIGVNYPAAFGGQASYAPDLSLSYGMSGVSASALPGFIQGAGAMVLGLTVDFKTKPATKMRVDYTHNYGGGLSNLSRDRDFATFSFTTSF